MSRWILALLALGIGVAIPAGYSFLYSRLAQRPLTLGNDVDLVNVLIVAAPYLLLALFNVRSLLPWVGALVMTLSLWTIWLNSTVSYALHPDGSGVDMGTIFLILISPVVISIAAFGVEALRRSTAARP